MATYIDVLLFSLLGSIVSLGGALLLLSNKKTADSFSKYATPFAAGALLAAAFLDLLPEASHAGDIEAALQGTLIGVLLFFLMEKFLHWFHHHHDDEEDTHRNSNASLIIAGDTIHNFIDGIAIAAGFLVSVPTGAVVALAVAAHEIPQEIGDFGLLLKKGLSAKKVIIVNLVSALATVVSALIFFKIGEATIANLDFILGITAGFFIYIAVSDIIPSIHKSESRKIAGPQTIMLIVGTLVVGLVTTTLHDYIDATSEPNDSGESQLIDSTHQDEDEH